VIDSVTPGYFDTVGMRILRGRDVSDADLPTTRPVVIVNEMLAMQYFDTLDVIDRSISFDGQADNWLTIAGVVSNARRTGPELDARAETYFPHGQRPAGSMTLVVRSSADPMALVPTIRETVRRLDAEQPVSRVNTLAAMLDTRLSERRFVLAVLGNFAIVALLLSVLGTYGVMSYTVGRRRHEFGIRAALGASAADLLRLVLRQGLAVTAIGVGIGMVGVFVVTRLVKGLLFGVSPTDPTVIIALTLLLSVSALVACWLPARHAAKADPVRALRQE
jgi:putative ABC transport system permease protein